MSIAYLVGKFGSGLAPGTVPAPAPITGHAVIRYTTLLQLNTTPGQLIPVTPVRLPIVDGVLCSATGVPSTSTPIPVQATDDPLLAQSGAVFAQIDLIFDGGSEPVQVVLALPTDATVDVATTARAGGPGAVFVSGLTPDQLTELDAGLAAVAADRAASTAAKVAAEAAAAQAIAVSTADLDPAAAALVGLPASVLRLALDGKFRNLLPGTYAARPAASAVPLAAIYHCTDIPEQYLSDGTTWIPVGSGGNELAYAQITANGTAAGPAVFTVPGLSITFLAGVRPVEVSFEAQFTAATPAVYAIAALSMGGTVLAADRRVVAIAGEEVVLRRTRRLTGLTPGQSYTIVVTAQTYTGTMTPSASTVNPSWIRAVTL